MKEGIFAQNLTFQPLVDKSQFFAFIKAEHENLTMNKQCNYTIQTEPHKVGNRK